MAAILQASHGHKGDVSDIFFDTTPKPLFFLHFPLVKE